MHEEILNPILQLIEVMRKNIQNKSFLRSLKAIVRKIKLLMSNKGLDKTIYDNLTKLRNKKLPNSYENVIDKIILPIMNIFKFIDDSVSIPKAKVNISLSNAYFYSFPQQAPKMSHA